MTKTDIKGVLTCLAIFSAAGILAGRAASQAIPAPEVKGWELAEQPQTFKPESLFEYIDGAAESYLGYDFRELRVFQFKGLEKAELTVEVYDMGNPRNAFGIFSVERSPESQIIEIGLDGYQEEGSLNFISGPYYVKLLCYGAGEAAPAALKAFARAVEAKAGERGNLPALLRAFPAEGLMPRSEKFILKNFLGYDFLHDGFVANYAVPDSEFDCFFIEGRDDAEAEAMMKRYLASLARNNPAAKDTAGVYRIRDKYALNIFLARTGRIICGVMRVKDGSEAVGEKYCAELIKSAEKMKL